MTANLDEVTINRLSEEILSLYDKATNQLDFTTIKSKLGDQVPSERINKALFELENEELVVRLPSGVYQLTERGGKTSPDQLIERRLRSQLEPADTWWKKRNRIWSVLIVVLPLLAIVGLTLTFAQVASFFGILMALASFYALIVLIALRLAFFTPRRDIQLMLRMFRGYKHLSAKELTKAESEFLAALRVLTPPQAYDWAGLAEDISKLFKCLSESIRTRLLGAVGVGESSSPMLTVLLHAVDQCAHPSFAAYEKAEQQLSRLPQYPYEIPSRWRDISRYSTMLVGVFDVGSSALSYYLLQSLRFTKDTAIIVAVSLLIGIPVIWFSYRQARR